MSDKSSKNTTRSKKATARKRREYSDLKLILMVFAVVVVAIVVGELAKKSPAGVANDTPTVAPVVKQYDAPPAMTIDTAKQYLATVKLEKGGEFVIELYPDKAPATVNSFVFLAREGYFDGVTFHRVLEGFMAQTGDPSGTGGGGPGYQFDNEYSDLNFDKEGVVAMANAGLNTNGSQFFITFAPVPLRSDEYTIFGQVISGMDVVKGITLRDPQKSPNFIGDVIESINIIEQD